MGFLKVLVKGHIILFDKTLLLTKDHEQERYTPFLCNHLGDHWENIGRKYRHFASVFSLSLQTTSCWGNPSYFKLPHKPKTSASQPTSVYEGPQG